MRQHTSQARHGWSAVWLASALALSAAHTATSAATLTDNTGQAASGDAVSADATNWIGASFATDASYSDATLTATLLASLTPTSSLALYSGDSSGLVPDTWLADLTLTGSTVNSGTFTLASATLSAGTHYWLVLHDGSAQAQWSWTASSAGSGSGFTGIWANSDDAGATWFTNSTLYPVQLKVDISSTATGNVPEPAGWLLSLAGLPLLARARRRQAA